MSPMEDRLRAALRDRVDDVTTQPALYRLVKERAARRRRRRLLAAVPAGAAAFGLALAVPLLLDGSPDVPRIEDLATQVPVTATTPERVVTLNASGEVALLDLADGAPVHEYGSVHLGGALPPMAVAPSDISPVPAAFVGTPQDTRGGTVLRQHRFMEEGLDVTEYHHGDDPTFAPWFDGGFAVSPDGRWIATFTGDVDGDGYLTLQVRPTDFRASTADGPEMQLEERISFAPGSVIQDWTGSLAASSGTSQVTVLDSEGQIVGVPLVHSGQEGYDERRVAPGVYEDSSFAVLSTAYPVGERAVAAYASSHLSDDVDGGTAYVLTSGGNGTVVQAVDGEEVLGQVDVTDLIGDQEPSVVALDAWGDTATLSTREGSWLLTHDGDGRFIQLVALPDGTVRAAPVGRDVAEVEPTDADPTDEVDATEAPAVPEDEAPDRTPPGDPTAPIVQADATTVWLRPGGDATDVPLLDLADQGDASVVEVAVRPGSSSTYLTVAALVTEDGVTGLRYIEIVDGDPQPPVTVDDPVLAPNARADGGLTVHGLAWTPDGGSLTWLERLGDDGPTVLRFTGWDDGPGTGEGPTDNDGFEAPSLDGTDARLVDWVDTADGWLVRFLATGGEPGTWVWRFERQPDGSLTPTAGDEGPVLQPVASTEVSSMRAFTGYDAAGQPPVQLVDRTVDGLTITGPSPGGSLGLPPEITEPGQLDAAWLHRLADDHLLLGADGRAFLHGADGWVDLGPAVDAAPVR